MMFLDYLEFPPVFSSWSYSRIFMSLCSAASNDVCAELDTFSLRSLEIWFQEAGPTSKICDITDSLRANPAISVETVVMTLAQKQVV